MVLARSRTLRHASCWLAHYFVKFSQIGPTGFLTLGRHRRMYCLAPCIASSRYAAPGLCSGSLGDTMQGARREVFHGHQSRRFVRNGVVNFRDVVVRDIHEELNRKKNNHPTPKTRFKSPSLIPRDSDQPTLRTPQPPRFGRLFFLSPVGDRAGQGVAADHPSGAAHDRGGGAVQHPPGTTAHEAFASRPGPFPPRRRPDIP